MSQDDDITKIDDLPDLDRSNEDESDFTSLEDMAKGLGIEDPLLNNLPELPSDDSNEFSDLNSEPDNEYEFSENEFDDESSNFEPSSFDDQDEALGDDSLQSDSDFSLDESESSFLSNDADFTEPEDLADEVTEEPQSSDEFNDYNIETPSDVSDLLSAPDDNFEMSDGKEDPFNDDLDKKLDLLDDEPSIEDNIDTPALEKKEFEETSLDSSDQEYSSPENFDEVKEFAESIQHEEALTPGNPPFSVILKEVKYQEDIDEILGILKEFNIIDETNIEKASTNLSSGQYLIPRISEYLAIHLCHKFRKFDLEILVGLTEEIHPPKSYNSNDRGPVTKNTLYNNKTFHLNEYVKPSQNEILTSTMNQIAGHEIKQYLGIITHRKKMNFTEVQDSKLEDTIYHNMSSDNQNRITELRIKRENLLATHSKRIWDKDLESPTSKREENAEEKLNKIYNILIDEMKGLAVNKSANAILGINFSITPISVDQYLHQGPQYEIICSGNLAWIEKNI